ncbi:MAG TPA: hypothetical protein VMT52_08935 [Planctomycetota bacterium]|nr:hypothetical protein [Planctomycetota bacterium]
MRPTRLFAAVLGCLAVSGLPRASVASTVDDSCLESWDLVNVQPGSATFQQLVPSSSYRPGTTVFALLASN